MILPLPFARVAVLGLGLSGLSVLTFLKRQGLEGWGWDDNPQTTTAAFPLYHPSLWPWHQLDRLVVSPGIALTHPVIQEARSRSIPITGDVGLWFETQPQGYFIGVTGTNGKSTTVSLIHHVLKNLGYTSFLGGNIGIPLFSDLIESSPRLPAQSSFYILELSSYQLELNPVLPITLPILTSLSSDHLERHGTTEAYIQAKAKLFASPQACQGLIMVDSAQTFQLAQQNPYLTPVFYPSVSEPYAHRASLKNGFHLRTEHNMIFSPQGLPLTPLDALTPLDRCQHPGTLLMAYSALVMIFQTFLRNHDRLYHVPALFQNFSGLPHRQENLGTYNGITYINDSKSTNAPALVSALKRFSEDGKTLYWIGGGRPKRDDGALINFLSTPHAWHSVVWCGLFGEARHQLYTSLHHHPDRFQAETMRDVLTAAHNHIRKTNPPHPIILLSPGCSSFDQFANFQERGTVFKQALSEFIHAPLS